jgi:hypothetical protein
MFLFFLMLSTVGSQNVDLASKLPILFVISAICAGVELLPIGKTSGSGSCRSYLVEHKPSPTVLISFFFSFSSFFQATIMLTFL